MNVAAATTTKTGGEEEELQLHRLALLFGATAEGLWPLLNNVALVGWALLCLAPTRKVAHAATLLIPLFHSTLYALCVLSVSMYPDQQAQQQQQAAPDFSTLRGVAEMFRTSADAVFLGWTHFVAFDLLVGRWIVLDYIAVAAAASSSSNSYNYVLHWIAVVPCLLLTLLLGPVGLLSYAILKFLFLGGLRSGGGGSSFLCLDPQRQQQQGGAAKKKAG